MSYAPHKTWIEQADAAEDIHERFGLERALSYLVSEKFLNFLREADRRAEFAAELPALAARIREIFEPHEIRACLDGRAAPALSLEVEEAEAEDMMEAMERIMLVERARELLLG